MSTTLEKRSLREALCDAEAFQRLFVGTYERWEIAGSVRRRKDAVGDVEHVVIPCVQTVRGDDLFGTPRQVNCVMERADALLREGVLITKHVYGQDAHGAPVHRWGERHRGMDFRGFNHELFTASASSWGSVLAIRTGPAEYSTMLVTRLRHHGYRNHLGHVWRCAVCPASDGRRCAAACEHCQGTGLKPVSIEPVQTELAFFDLAGVAWIEPERRS